jgi:hypothetical protein
MTRGLDLGRHYGASFGYELPGYAPVEEGQEDPGPVCAASAGSALAECATNELADVFMPPSFHASIEAAGYQMW